MCNKIISPIELSLLRSSKIEMLGPQSGGRGFPSVKVSFGFEKKEIAKCCQAFFPDVVAEQIGQFASSRLMMMSTGKAYNYMDEYRVVSTSGIETLAEQRKKNIQKKIIDTFPILRNIERHHDFFSELGIKTWYNQHVIDHTWPFEESSKEMIARYKSNRSR